MSPRRSNRPTRAFLCWLPFLLASLLPHALLAQAPNFQHTPDGLNQNFVPVYTTTPGTGILAATVFSEKTTNPLQRQQALLKLVNLTTQATIWATTDQRSIGAFTDLAYGEYDVEVSVVGYLSEHRPVRIINSAPVRLDVVLHHDPDAVKLDANAGVLPPKARREMKRAVAALKSQDYKKAEISLNQACALAPDSAQLNFLRGYLYFQQREWDRAAHFLDAATTLNSQDAQALTLLGRADLERRDYPASRSALEKAVALDGSPWLPHDLLANADFQLKKYDSARDQAQIAIDKGRGKGESDANPARLILGEALINLGNEERGIEALNRFLQESPHHPLAGRVRSLIDEIQERHSSVPPQAQSSGAQSSGAPSSMGQSSAGPSAMAASYAEPGSGGSKFTGVDLLEALPQPGFSAKSWQPPSLDDLKVAVAPGVSCPAEKILQETGKHVQELSEDLARFAAVEDLFHQRLDVFGNPLSAESRKYNYVASISEPEPGFLSVEEYRSAKSDLQSYPDQIASTGFAALALVFHPHMQEEFAINCEGLGEWQGRAAWVMRFQQRDDKPNRIHSYTVGNITHPVKLKGRAWITADGYAIAHIESEMVRPMPEIKLLSEHQIVDYGPIRFDARKTSLWLPQRAEIYFDFRQHLYYRRHSFDHYMLFTVDSGQKTKYDEKLPPQEKSAQGGTAQEAPVKE
jgi:tetratricopeptide (TPR) repeat protein